ncbi:MAG: type II toxin-antitoxin system VapC family toxin, partial [Candidatus Woesearchaeota archaeon]
AYEFFVGLKEKELEAMRSFFKEVQIVDFGFESAFKSAEIEKKLQKKGNLINKMDILIAGTCSIHGFQLITCDHDFNKVTGLDVVVVS